MTVLSLFVVALAVLCATSLVVALVARSDRAALAIGTVGGVLGSGLGVVASVVALLADSDESLHGAWTLPIGEVDVGVDALSALFLLGIFVLGGLASVYGAGYLRGYRGRYALAPAVAFLNLLLASMAGVVLARDGVLFLMAWEAMSLTSFFLVSYESDREDVRRAGMTYLVASHLGTVFVFALFGVLARHAGGFGFDAIAHAPPPRRALAGACFALALVGFGTKAGFWPLHVWLPDAHPAAPSHVSALMSGVMIKMGIYGLLRVVTFLGTPRPWWGALVLAIGAVSGIAGILQALGQRDLKRVLAYSSVENIGVIALGIGLGLLGQSLSHPLIAFVGYAGALLHVVNHGLMKGLLFLATGSVVHATGTRDLEQLGGLSRRMPATALTFLVGALAISGLVPLNGFVGEWLVYRGAFMGGSELPTSWAVCAIAVVPVLALIGGLAVACFVRVFGIAFLGEPRSAAAIKAHEAPLAMRLPLLALAACCAAIGVAPSAALRLVERAAASLAGVTMAPTAALGALPGLTRLALALGVFIGALVLFRGLLLRKRATTAAPTWGCGYAAPAPSMQYSAASFASPALAPFSALVSKRIEVTPPDGYFPTAARYEEHYADAAGETLIVPLAQRVLKLSARLRVIQQGRVQLYLGYILVTLIALLLWQLGQGAG